MLVNHTSIAPRAVVIPGPDARIQGYLTLPPQAHGIVVFAHGSGSGRDSPRNQYVASTLQRGGLATLLVDLLTEAENDDRKKVFDIELLTDRLLVVTDWLAGMAETASLSLGYFGASTGAAAALTAAARRPKNVLAVVSRGGRPDLAESILPDVVAPTLLIVGGDDSVVLELNQQAYSLLACPKKLAIIPGATHLFPEPGALEQVSILARGWFLRYLGA